MVDIFKADSNLNEKEELLRLLSQEGSNDDHYLGVSKKVREYRRHFYRTTPPYYAEFMRKYLLIKFQNNLFPMDPVEGNVVAGFLNCMIPYALIQLLCWSRHSATGELTQEVTMKIVYEVERKTDHSINIYKHLLQTPSMLRIDSYTECFSEI